MLKKATAILGSSWGDEGKGLFTDFASRFGTTTVVRFNGGAQAGHTVVMADGRRHVFHHFGSGSFRGATTFLSRFFINNPILFFQELGELRKLGLNPRVIVDPRGYVTTPYDMMINQIIEEARGTTRHGSCGTGINETMKRSEMPEFCLKVADLDRLTFPRLLKNIREYYVPTRLADLGVTPNADWLNHLNSDGILNHFVADATSFYRAVECASDHLATCEDIVFEGAQGLLLDQDHYFFPHVTHSHTGLKNVMILAQEAKIEAVDVTYVTRAYATRHGAGPFPREVTNNGLTFEDNTNLLNAWQGGLRFGQLDLDLLTESITHDLTHAVLPVRPALAITHMDQMGPEIALWQEQQLRYLAPKEMARRVQDWTHMPVDFLSFGAQAEDVIESPAGIQKSR